MVARLAAAGFLAAILSLAFSPVLFEGRTFSSAAWVPGVLPTGPASHPARPEAPAPVRDIEGATWVDEPAPYLVHRGLSEGAMPLWNDREGLGLPLLGNPNTGALSPLQLAVNVAPSAWMQDLAWAARVFLLGLFTLGLARELGVGWMGAIAGAVALMLSGQTIEWIEHHPLNTDVFVPAALWAALAIRRTGISGIPWLALAVGAGLLGVKPQSAIMAGLFGLFWLLAETADRAGEEGRPVGLRFGSWVGGLVLGMGVAAVALVPFAETYEGASGLVQAGRTTQSDWALPIAALSSLGGSLAVELQHLPTGAVPDPNLPRGPGLPYAGLAVIAGAALGFWSTRESWLTRALALTVVVEVLRIHGLLPVPLGSVPVLGSINFVKYCFPLYLALALLVARAVDALPGPVAAGALALVVAELLWIVPRGWAERTDPYAPAPWVDALVRLEGERPGRMSGPFVLAPPLVSSAIGFRDLRSIDVLTPRDTYDFVGRLVAPSQGVTWILADPSPLLAATGPGSNVADLRWIVARSALEAATLPAAVREATTARRLVRLFGAMERQSIETRSLSGGLHDGGNDRRFHWTCETPCRFTFVFPRLPDHFVVGLAAPERVSLRVRLGTETGDAPLERVPAGRSWHDLWLDPVQNAGAPGTIVLEIDSEAPASIFVGGVGPAEAPELEAVREGQELAYRAGALARLELRHEDEEAHIYENTGALGEAWVASRVVSVEGRDAAFACVAKHAGDAVACIPEDQAAPAELPAGDGRGRVTISESLSGQLRVQTSTRAPGLLVVSRLHDPGWRGFVDGESVALLRANGALIGIPIPAGDHDVEIEYAPASFRIGLAITILSLLALTLLAFRYREPVPGQV